MFCFVPVTKYIQQLSSIEVSDVSFWFPFWCICIICSLCHFLIYLILLRFSFFTDLTFVLLKCSSAPFDCFLLCIIIFPPIFGHFQNVCPHTISHHLLICLTLTFCWQFESAVYYVTVCVHVYSHCFYNALGKVRFLFVSLLIQLQSLNYE